ncbi:MAG: hypothetical protein IJ814_06090 [Paludibacteraceae bacterium]|nr:hypothetical protein [Paludibacteraceae bacterium]
MKTNGKSIVLYPYFWIQNRLWGIDFTGQYIMMLIIKRWIARWNAWRHPKNMKEIETSLHEKTNEMLVKNAKLLEEYNRRRDERTEK